MRSKKTAGLSGVALLTVPGAPWLRELGPCGRQEALQADRGQK
jgi:hypothetical protein